jgi:hypothetical protein
VEFDGCRSRESMANITNGKYSPHTPYRLSTRESQEMTLIEEQEKNRIKKVNFVLI